MSNILTVGISEWKMAGVPDHLRSAGLGSCVAVVLYTKIPSLAAMAHVMLPDHALAKGDYLPAKFADTAIPLLVDRLIKEGVKRSSICAKLSGGAEMFPSMNSRMPSIGVRNAEAIKNALKQHQIRVVAEEIGGNAGRTVEFYTETGILHIRTVKSGVHEI